MFSPDKPYNDLPPIPDVGTLETNRTLKQAISANRILAELKAGGNLIPNQVVLLRSILLQEALASSEIENVVTTNDALYKAFDNKDESSDPNTREVLRYGDALWAGFNDLQQGGAIRPSLLVSLAKKIKGSPIDIRSTVGCQITNDTTREVIYTPPVGRDLILNKMNGLCEFLADPNGADPLIKMVVAHRQFEAIHPFPDGNGRTGRVLNILYLIQAGLLERPVLYLSWYIVRNKAEYYQRLRAVTENDDWENWIIYMLQAVETTAAMTRDMLLRVREFMDNSALIAKSDMRKGYSRELVDLVFSQPYTRISLVAEHLGIGRNAASEYLRELERLDLLQGLKIGRERLYYNFHLAAALEIQEEK
ncbi:MAG: Fic/DOC family N-terminal domain-containing protein [Chthonomonadales bacterium]